MKIALVTGVTSGIGYAITKKLLEKQYIVYGIGRDFSNFKIANENFNEIKCDLLNNQEFESKMKSLKKIKFDLIVNSAGVAFFGLHEEINIFKIREMVRLNLEIPMIITQYFLRTLKETKGTLINISSITAKKESPLAATYSATKAGLTHFSNSLFKEVRKYGVKVVVIHPDMVKTNFYKNTFFECCDDNETFINTKDIENIIEFILIQSPNILLSDITIQPQKHGIKKKGKA